ncbi:MAG: response regulator [Planctomycetaceae bacterium]|jgi:CheY-like chemotaxis protein|nr:response regulator [Planctomycetaceae bacterium]
MTQRLFKVLFVDDDPDFRTEFTSLLKSNAFEVIEAASEEAAKSVLERDAFDIAVVNLMLENSDSGFTICYQIKKKSPNIPVVLLNSANSEKSVEFSLESESERAWIKANVILEKPVRFEQLLATIYDQMGIVGKV